MPERCATPSTSTAHPQHEGRRRQMQYIGKLMRQADEAPLREAVAAFQLGRPATTLALHEAERWRAELIADDEALTAGCWPTPTPTPAACAAWCAPRAATPPRLAARAAQPRSFRELFQFIKPGS
jgi:ribosome-associated protein